jgi:hypothetical protein
MFFEQVAIETPEATAALFRRGDAGKPLGGLPTASFLTTQIGVPDKL